MSILKRYDTDPTCAVDYAKALTERLIVPVPETFDGGPINQVVQCMVGVVGDIRPGKAVHAPDEHRVHPVTHKVTPHNGWDVGFLNPKSFSAFELLGSFKARHPDAQIVKQAYDDVSGHYIVISWTTPKPASVMRSGTPQPDQWRVSLCHFTRNGDTYKQGTTGRSTNRPHVHITVRINGKIC